MAYRIDTTLQGGRFTVVVPSAAEAIDALADLRARVHEDLTVETLHAPLDLEALSERERQDRDDGEIAMRRAFDAPT
jgi:hypothetical protein